MAADREHYTTLYTVRDRADHVVASNGEGRQGASVLVPNCPVSAHRYRTYLRCFLKHLLYKYEYRQYKYNILRVDRWIFIH